MPKTKKTTTGKRANIWQNWLLNICRKSKKACRLKGEIVGPRPNRNRRRRHRAHCDRGAKVPRGGGAGSVGDTPYAPTGLRAAGHHASHTTYLPTTQRPQRPGEGHPAKRVPHKCSDQGTHPSHYPTAPHRVPRGQHPHPVASCLPFPSGPNGHHLCADMALHGVFYRATKLFYPRPGCQSHAKGLFFMVGPPSGQDIIE